MAASIKDVKTDLLFEQLMQMDGKAEIVDGEIVEITPTGDEPGEAGDAIMASLWNYVLRVRRGRAVGANKAFAANLEHRKSFSPDAAFYIGPGGSMKFFPQPPVFAVEVRSENDYGRAAELAIATKIADYFAAGTIVVWDVDLQSANILKVFRASDPQNPVVYRRGEIANAEPAVPGWSLEVNALFA